MNPVRAATVVQGCRAATARAVVRIRTRTDDGNGAQAPGHPQRPPARSRGRDRGPRRHPDRRRGHRRGRASRHGGAGRGPGHRRLGPAVDARPGQCPHPRPRRAQQGPGRQVVARAAAQRRALGERRLRPRGQVHLGAAQRRRDGAQGLHRRLRHVLRVPDALARRAERGRQGLRRGRPARRGRADDGGYDPLPGHPGAARLAARAAPRPRREAARRALARPHRGLPVPARRLAVRARAGLPGAGAHHPAPLQRRLHPRLPRPGPGLRPPHPDAPGRIRGPGGDRD